MAVREKLGGAVDFFTDIAKIVIISLLIIIPIRYFVVQPFFVKGASMEPSYHQGDYLLVDEISYRFTDPERGDVIIFKFPGNTSQHYIKRVIGLPGETIQIQDGKVYVVNDEYPEGRAIDEKYLASGTRTQGGDSVELEEDEYYVLGDNRNASHDSRVWGELEEDFIVGRVFLRAWPFSDFSLIESPSY